MFLRISVHLRGRRIGGPDRQIASAGFVERLFLLRREPVVGGGGALISKTDLLRRCPVGAHAKDSLKTTAARLLTFVHNSWVVAQPEKKAREAERDSDARRKSHQKGIS